MADITVSSNVDSFMQAADYAAMKVLLSLNNVENTALSTWAGSTSLTTVGTITTGTWNGTTIAAANGGTGLTALSANVVTLLGAANYAAFRVSLSLVIGTDVQAYNANLTTFAGIAPSANVQTLLGAANYAAFKTSLSLNNVENTALSTWTGSTSVTTLGTIVTGTWTGTAIAAANGGTGLTSFTTGDLLYATGSTAIGKLAVVASGSILVSGTTPAWSNTPALGTPTGNLVNCTGYTFNNLASTTGAITNTMIANGTIDLAAKVTGTLADARLSANVPLLNGANTFSAANILSVAGAASVPALKISGLPFAGTGTTSFPQLYVNDSTATASTTLNTSGTYFGVNGHASQDLANLMIDGVSKCKVSSAGLLTTASFIIAGNSVQVPNNSDFEWLGRTRLNCAADGTVQFVNNAASNFTGLDFGNSTNSFGRIGRDSVNGFTFQSAAGTATWNDASTANSGTVANRYLVGIAAPTLTATGTSVTDTVASTFYIGGAPTASTNTTIGTGWALNVAAGNCNFGGITVHGAQTRLKGYTVATLPAAAQGDLVFATDLLAPTFLTTATGGGAVVGTVFYNGTAWVTN